MSEIVKLSEVQAFTTKDVYVGDQIQLYLEDNPSTGYTWKITFIDEKILAQVGKEEFVAKGSKIGSKGNSIYTFDVLSSGFTKLQLEYSRPWQKNPKDKNFSIEFEVKDKK